MTHEPGSKGAGRRIAIGFFGITRSLSHTLPSIQTHVIAPAQAAADEVRVYAHFFQQDRIENPRTGETGALEADAHRLLAIDRLELEAPETCLETWDFEALKSHGDVWKNEFMSLRNLVHQLHSLDRLTQAMLADGVEVCLFVRPDLRYDDSLAPIIARALAAQEAQEAGVWLPYWQSWWGVNDRFAAVAGTSAIKAYGQRIRHIPAYLEQTAAPVHSERLLAHSLEAAGLKVHKTGARATRIRSGGESAPESFDHPLFLSLINVDIRLINRVLRGLNKLGFPRVRLPLRRSQGSPDIRK